MDNCVKYLEKLNHKDDLKDNIIKRYKQGKTLSEKETQIMFDKYFQHRQAVKYFKENKDLNPFETSLKEQFERKGFLTSKQLHALFKKNQK